MWKIKQIFDGDYGCEELQPNEKRKVTVYLVDEDGNERSVRVEDEWLVQNGLDEGNTVELDEKNEIIKIACP